jgi:hypothetical protein
VTWKKELDTERVEQSQRGLEAQVALAVEESRQPAGVQPAVLGELDQGRVTNRETLFRRLVETR